MPKPSLRINSTPLDFKELPPAIRNAYAVICKLPDGELYSTRELIKRCKLAERTIDSSIPEFPDITDLHKHKRIFGNPRSIALYREQRSAYEAGK